MNDNRGQPFSLTFVIYTYFLIPGTLYYNNILYF